MRYNEFKKLELLLNEDINKKIIVWGAAVKGRVFKKWLERASCIDRVECFVDSDIMRHGKTIEGIPICAPEILSDKDNDYVVYIASAATEAISKNIEQINPKVKYAEVCQFCVSSRIEETFSVYKEKVSFYILGDNGEYKREAEYFSRFGIDISSVIRVSELKEKQREDKNVYLLVDTEHIRIENELIKRGYHYNIDYVVMPEIFVEEYIYTKDGKCPENFDKGNEADKGLKEYFCPLPFTQLFYYDYRSDICSPTWNNNVNVGNPQEMNIGEIWNSEKAKEIRASVLDGSFKFCNEDICWRMLEGKLLKKDDITDAKLRDIIDNNKVVIEDGPEFLNVGYNVACNLYCRMCRDGFVFDNPEVKKKALQNIKDYDFKNLKRLIIPGNGELFANKDYMDILMNIDDFKFPALEAIWIYSNGVLFTEENWNKIAFLGKRYKLKIFISTDSVCEETFMKVRRGGSYDKFMNNLKMLVRKRHQGEFYKLYLPFCVQKENFREMERFVYFAKELGVDCVHFEKLFNNSISESVHRPENVYYEEFVKQLLLARDAGKKCGIEVEMKPFTDILKKQGDI